MKLLQRWFTLERWNSNPWKLYQLIAIMWAMALQIIDTDHLDHAAVASTLLVGALITLIALHLRDETASRNVERWAYLALIWSMCCYLALAFQGAGWEGLILQQNLGIVLVEAIVVGSFHRMIWLTFRGQLHRRKVRKEAKKVVVAVKEGKDLPLIRTTPRRGTTSPLAS